MNWESAKDHCKQRNWEWTLNILEKVQKEMEELQAENQRLKSQQKLDNH